MNFLKLESRALPTSTQVLAEVNDSLAHNDRAKILIVDDNAANLLALRAVLSSPEYEIFETDNGLRAIQMCEEQEFAAVILDISMPVLDGFQTARQIKTTRLNPEVPIIFVTATFRDDPYVRKGFEAGAVDFFGKPFDPEILKAKVSIYTDLYLKSRRLQETEALLQTHAQIKTLLEAMPVGVIVADVDGQVYESNDIARKIWGGSIEGRLDSEACGLAKAIARGEATQNEIVEIENFDGKTKTLSNSAFPIRNRHGEILGAVAVLQDVTSQVALARRVTSQIPADL